MKFHVSERGAVETMKHEDAYTRTHLAGGVYES